MERDYLLLDPEVPEDWGNWCQEKKMLTIQTGNK